MFIDSVPVVSGVPQGSGLGFLLYLLFINDLPDKIISKTCLFADDCIVYRPIYILIDCAVLQQDLDALAEWESKWGTEFHPQKCSVLRVSRSKPPISHPYKLKGPILITENTTKYLGVDLQTTLSWKTHIDRISKKTNSMLGFLRRNLRSCSEPHQSQPLLQHGPLKLGILLVCLEPTPEGSDTETGDDSKKSCPVHN